MSIKLNMRYLFLFITLTLIEVIIALFIHDNFIRSYLGDVLVVIVVYCLLRIFLLPHPSLPLWVFLFATTVEVAQYFDIVSLLGVSKNRFLSTLLGSVFDFKDVLCYFVGCFLLVLWQRFSNTKSKGLLQN